MKKTLKKINSYSTFRFAIVGTIGFLVDACILHLLFRGLGPVVARIISFLCAVTVTWFLNRRFTFKSKAAWYKEWGHYTLATSLGALINVGSYMILILHVREFYKHPIGALIISSLLAMSINYCISKFFVFSKKRI